MDTDRAPDRFVSMAATERFSAVVRLQDDTTLVMLNGEIDLATRDSFAGAMCGLLRPGERVTVDLSGLTLLDGAGVALALRLQQSARELGGDLTVVHAHGMVARVLEILDPEHTLARAEST